jgi:hypothetical protein
VVQAHGLNRRQEDPLAPLVEALGGPRSSVVASEDRLMRLGGRRGGPPLAEVVGQVIEQSHRAAATSLGCADRQRSLLRVDPPQCAELLRAQAGVGEHRDDRGVAEVQCGSRQPVRARDASFGSVEEHSAHLLDRFGGERPYLVAHRCACHAHRASRVGEDQARLRCVAQHALENDVHRLASPLVAESGSKKLRLQARDRVGRQLSERHVAEARRDVAVVVARVVTACLRRE